MSILAASRAWRAVPSLRPASLLRWNTTLHTPPPDPPPRPPPDEASASASSSTTPSSAEIPTSPTPPERPPWTRNPSWREDPRTGIVARIKSRRPHISLDAPRLWKRPVPEGALPAYDEALKYLQADSENLKTEAAALEADIANREAAKTVEEMSEEERAELEGMRETLRIVQVQSEVNLPDVRWYFRNGMGDFTKPVYRHLNERKWRDEGALDLLMERIHQMNVVPDMLPSIHPSFDLRVRFSKAGGRRKPSEANVEPGAFLKPVETLNAPALYASVFHPDTRYYTLVMLDLDVPDAENATFTAYLHWLVPNIPLNALATTIPIPAAHAAYVPPHPQKGTPYHRYVLTLLPHPDPLQKIELPRFVLPEGSVWTDVGEEPVKAAPLMENLSPATDAKLVGETTTQVHAEETAVLPPTTSAVKKRDPFASALAQIRAHPPPTPPSLSTELRARRGFDMRAFCAEFGFDMAKGGAAHMWREVWSADVSRVYSELLRTREPVYGFPKHVDPYEDIKTTPKYSHF